MRMLGNGFIPHFTGAGWTYLLRDEFSDTLAAGGVNNTLATDGSLRTATDSNSKMSVGSGILSFATGGVGAGNPGSWYPLRTRSVGLVATAKLNQSSAGLAAGFGTNQSGALNDAIVLNGTTLQIIANGTTVTVGSISLSTDYIIYVALRATGAHFYIQGGTFTYPSLIFISATGNANEYPGVVTIGTTSIGSADYIRSAGYYLAPPLASHGFDSSATLSDGNGHAETSGLGSGGSGVAMSGTTWSVSGGNGINTPAIGSELLTNGDMEGAYVAGVAPNWTTVGTVTPTESATAYTGSKAQQVTNTDGASGNGVYQNVSMTTGEWLLVTGWSKNISGAGGKIGIYNGSVVVQNSTGLLSSSSYQLGAVSTRCIASGNARVQLLGFGSGVIALFDNISAKKLLLKDLLSLHASTTNDVFAGIDLAVVSGTQVGLALNWDSSTNPQNGTLVYCDGTNCKIDKCVAGVWTNVLSSAVTTSRLIVGKIGSSYRAYTPTALIGSVTIADAGIVSNTLHGLFNTYEGNTLDNYTCYASGTGGEYSILDTI